MHALVFAHQPHQRAVGVRLVLVELDQIPVIPRGGWHRLVGIVESGLAERIFVPLDTGDLAGFAADASSDVDQLANLELTLHAVAGNGPDVAGDCLNLKRSFCSHFGTSPLSLFDLHQEGLVFRRVSIRIEDGR